MVFKMKKKISDKINQNINTLRIQQDDYTSGVVTQLVTFKKKNIRTLIWRHEAPGPERSPAYDATC